MALTVSHLNTMLRRAKAQLAFRHQTRSSMALQLHDKRTDTPYRGTLLGPQRKVITVTDELRVRGLTGKIAAITAGWQERESEDDELQEAIGHRAINLRLHARVDEVFARDADLFAAHRHRQDQLRTLQELYRLRLDRTYDAARAIYARTGPAVLLEPERQAAIEALRELDAHHLRRIHQIHGDFEASVQPTRRGVLVEHRGQIAEIIAKCRVLAVAGGHVSTLLNRMRLLDIPRAMGHLPVIAWSAGAMVMTERVVLFHDRPPEGPGIAEVLDVGLGVFPDVIALPHATARLNTADSLRMSIFAKRFYPAICLALDPGSRATWDGNNWTATPETAMIALDGEFIPLAMTAQQGGAP